MKEENERLVSFSFFFLFVDISSKKKRKKHDHQFHPPLFFSLLLLLFLIPKCLPSSRRTLDFAAAACVWLRVVFKKRGNVVEMKHSRRRRRQKPRPRQHQKSKTEPRCVGDRRRPRVRPVGQAGAAKGPRAGGEEGRGASRGCSSSGSREDEGRQGPRLSNSRPSDQRPLVRFLFVVFKRGMKIEIERER